MVPDLEIFYREIADSVVNLEDEKAIDLANQAIMNNYDLILVIEKGYAAGLRRVGDLFDEGEYFLPELMMGASIVQDSLKILTKHIKNDQKREMLGTVVMATIEGDLHSIGKNIVSILLSVNGFRVYDLGADVKIDKIIEEAELKNADIIGVSALLTTTMKGQKLLIERLKERGIRNKYKVILGGAPVNREWVENCQADGFASTALEAVAILKKWMK